MKQRARASVLSVPEEAEEARPCFYYPRGRRRRQLLGQGKPYARQILSLPHPPRTPTSPRPRTPSTPACTSSRAPRAHVYDVARSSAAHVLDPTAARAFHAGRIITARFPRPLPRHQVQGRRSRLRRAAPAPELRVPLAWRGLGSRQGHRTRTTDVEIKYKLPRHAAAALAHHQHPAVPNWLL